MPDTEQLDALEAALLDMRADAAYALVVLGPLADHDRARPLIAALTRVQCDLADLVNTRTD